MAQITASGQADNSTVTLRQVSAAYLGLINAVALSVYNESGGVATGRLFVTDASDVEQYSIMSFTLADGLSLCGQLSFPKAIQIAATYKIKIDSNAADCLVDGFVHLFETT